MLKFKNLSQIVIFLSVENKSFEMINKLRKENMKKLEKNNDVFLDSWTLVYDDCQSWSWYDLQWTYDTFLCRKRFEHKLGERRGEMFVRGLKKYTWQAGEMQSYVMILMIAHWMSIAGNAGGKGGISSFEHFLFTLNKTRGS